nr:Crp/Fnr family transcriptional regulator [Solibacillus sp. MA9]
MPITITTFFQTKGILLKVEKGMHIFQEGSLADQLYLIKKGTVQISKETESGKELAIRICGEHNLIGETTVFCCSTFHTTTAKAIMNTELYAISRNLFENYLHHEPTIMTDYLKWLQIEHIKDQSRLRDLVLHGKKGALYSTLIRLANTYGEFQSPNEVTIRLALTNTELANLCATSREMINRMLSELRKQHVLSTEKSYITIHNLSFLKREIECENCPLAVCRID